MKKWPEKAYKWYREACETFDYPSGPYGKAIRELIEKDDTVLDVGCGIGAASIMMAPLCRRVIALDKDEMALNELAERAREDGVSNIEIVRHSWPIETPISADIIIALHVAQVFRSFANVKPMFESAKRGGFIACQAPVSREDEPFLALKEELGIAPNYDRCDNGCYIKGALEALGATVKCEKAVYDFGQPLNCMDDVCNFIAWQIDAEDSMLETIKKNADAYVHKTGEKFLVPIKRQSCGITFLK
jgi:SAM-dependent methyltransferase